MRDRLERFMAGRYGMDQLSRFIDFVALALLIVSIFVRFPLIFYIAAALIVWSYFRMFSKNIGKRSMENERFLAVWDRLTARGQNRRYYQEQRKIYRYFRCPGCRQKVRVPKGKGKICITCPKCRMEFIRKS